MAAAYGHIDTVRYLVEMCDVDLLFEDEVIHKKCKFSKKLVLENWNPYYFAVLSYDIVLGPCDVATSCVLPQRHHGGT